MRQAKQAILPAYLLLCLLVGGSAQAMWGNAILQLGALGLLAWAVLTPEPQPIPPAGRQLLMLVGLVALLFLVQLIPLPPVIWQALPGREFLADGFSMLGMPMPWQSVSLAPFATMETALTLLPPFALLVAMLRLRSWSVTWMFAAVVAGAAVSIVLGLMQVAGGGETWYFYQRTNVGVAVGTFANGNHFATLLLAALPLLAVLLTGRWRSQRKRPQRAFTGALAVAAAAILAIGFLLNGSAAILLLGPAVVLGAALLAFRIPQRRVRQGLAVIGLLLASAAALVVVFGSDLPGWGTEASIETRSEYWSKSLRAAKDHALTGSGIGTFEPVYRRYEDPGAVDRWYVNHAHNDYLELAVEGGIAAVILVLLFLAWWLTRAYAAWLSPGASSEQKAAVVASAAILLHSAFDYPLRTAAIAGIFAVCLALLAGARSTRRVRQKDAEEQPAVRHAKL